MKIKNLLSSSGVSLIEMTIVLGLIGVAGVGVMKLTENSTKATQNIKNIDDITQLKNQISDILKNPNNCEAALAGRTLNSSVPILYQVINGVASPKFSVEAIPANPNKVSIESMQILNLDANGTNGSGALATLRIGFRKQAAGSIGGKVLNRDISINANLCQKNFISIASTAEISTLMSQCGGAQKRLIDGPHLWGTLRWGVCQDCTNALTANLINSCQSQGSGGGVDVGSLSELTCATQGGTWDTANSSCNMDENSAEASCTSLGGTFVSPNCTFSGASLTQHIVNTQPACVFLSACGGTYPTNSGTFVIKKTGTQNYTWYNRTCNPTYVRKSGALCAANYSAYGSCGGYGSSHSWHGSCTTGGRNGNETCNPSGGTWQHDCTGCGDGCFSRNGYNCGTTSTETRTENIETNETIYKCCK